MSRRRNVRRSLNTRSGLAAFLRRPAVQGAMVLIVIFIVYLIASAGGASSSALAGEVGVDKAYEMYKAGAFVVDVCTLAEWNEYHALNTTFIPLEELQARLSEIPKDKEIIVVDRSGSRSQQGRDILLAAGYKATSMTGGLKEWYAKGYPIEGAPQ